MNRLDYLLVAGGGGYTTFSSFSLQTLNLATDGAWLRAAANVMLSAVLCLGAVLLGHLCATVISR
jgi:CrcB protein